MCSAFVWLLCFYRIPPGGTAVVAASITLFAIGFLLISLRPVISRHLSFPVAHAFIFLGYALFFYGLCLFCGRKTNVAAVVATFIAYVAEFTYFYYVDDRFFVRVFFYLLVHGIILALAYRVVWQELTKNRLRSYRVASLFILLSAILSFVGAAVTLYGIGQDSRGIDILTLRGMNVAFVVDHFVFITGWTFSFTLMVNERLFSEKVRAEAAMAKYAGSLEASNRELANFSYSVSHDLQEPLRNISSFAQLLQAKYGGVIDSAADEYLSFIIIGVRRMKAMINDVLEYSRLEGVDIPFGNVDLGEVFRSACDNLQQEIEAAGVLITVGRLPIVTGGFVPLQSVFQNLISNAIKYQPPGRRPEIVVAALFAEGMWRISVRDNGIGIAPQYSDQIFVVFRRLHTREQYEGSGIGLAVCRRIIERHGGRIWVESVEGQGATFFFTLRDASVTA